MLPYVIDNQKRTRNHQVSLLHTATKLAPSITWFLINMHNYLLAPWKLEFGSSQSFDSSCFVVVLASDRYEGLPNMHTRNGTLGFTESTSHSSLKPIGSSTRQHFINTDNVERVNSHTNMKCVFTSNFGHVFVGTDTRSL